MAALPLVVVADPVDRASVERLRSGPCRVLDTSADPAALGTHLAEAWGLIVRSRTKVTADLLAKAPQLKLIARAGVGLDNIDLPAAKKRGIQIVNSPSAASASVAELTIALYLALLRGLYPAIAATKGGRWERSTHGHELAGRTVGFVGYGRIAREVARRLRVFGARTIAYDPFVTSPVDGTEMRTLNETLAGADIVSVHAASTPENRHLIDAAALAAMRPGSYLVNVARGALVDEGALLEALTSGHLAGAALDVFESEPPTNRALLEHPKVVATPHVGASTEEGQQRAGSEIVAEVLRVLGSATPPTAATPAGVAP